MIATTTCYRAHCGWYDFLRSLFLSSSLSLSLSPRSGHQYGINCSKLWVYRQYSCTRMLLMRAVALLTAAAVAVTQANTKFRDVCPVTCEDCEVAPPPQLCGPNSLWTPYSTISRSTKTAGAAKKRPGWRDATQVYAAIGGTFWVIALHYYW